MKKLEITTHSTEETQALAQNILDQKINIITLEGELGSGKTTLTQGIGELLGIDRMTSPTFTIVKEYPLGDNVYQFKKLYHIDLYRLHAEEEVKELGLSELWTNSQNLVIIEWPKIIEEHLPNHLEVNIEINGPKSRRITISPQI